MEILVVLAIIALAMTFAMVVVSGARKKSRDTRRQADLKEMRSAIEFYVSDNGEAPDSLADLVPQNMPIIPVDPLGGTSYGYVDLGGSSYALAAALETLGQAEPLGSDFDGAIPITVNGQARNCNENAGASNESLYCLYWP